MTVKITDWLHPTIVPDAAKLGRRPDWIRFFAVDGDERPRTGITVDHGVLRQVFPAQYTGIAALPGTGWAGGLPAGINRMLVGGDLAPLAILEALAALAADGPKQYWPTEEQWEAMENVEINLPISDYRQPYPALVVGIPLGARARLAARVGLDPGPMPKAVLVRNRRAPGEEPLVIAHMGQMHTRREVFYIFQHQPKNPTVEAALERDAGAEVGQDEPEKMFRFGLVAARAAMNLAMMLCHYGCHVAPRTFKNRREQRQSERHGDFQTVLMKQVVTVRDTTRDAPGTGEARGPGPEMPPHWVRGHWRAKAGHAERRAAGETVPLVFVRPYLVRPDRLVGDLSKSSAEYRA